MMPTDGFVILPRRHCDHPFWLGEKFSRGQAIADLDYLAAFTAHEVNINGHILFLDAGDIAGAIRFFTNRWRWSLRKTASFLARLVADKILVKKRNGTGNGSPSIYHIVNYDTYRHAKPPERNGSEYGRDTAEKRLGDKTKKRKKGKKENTSSSAAAAALLSAFAPADKDLLLQTIAAVGTTNSSGELTQSEADQLIREFSKFPHGAVLNACRIYINRGYACTGKDAKYLLGIMRRISGNEESSASQTKSKTIKTEGQSAIDRAVASLKKENNNAISK
jgi:hypothetical protein